MRTADTLAKTHDGKWVVVHSPEVPIHEQREQLRKLLGQPTHPDFAVLQYRESDGDSRTLRFGKPSTDLNAAPVASVPAENQNQNSKKKNKQ
jgi:hypothetical protein